MLHVALRITAFTQTAQAIVQHMAERMTTLPGICTYYGFRTSDITPIWAPGAQKTKSPPQTLLDSNVLFWLHKLYVFIHCYLLDKNRFLKNKNWFLK